MAFSDFLKKIFSKQDNEPGREKISISELKAYLISREDSLNSKELETLDRVKARLAELTSQLESQIRVLESIDINKKRAEEKIIFIVKENLFLYVKYLKKFIESLKSIGKENFLENLNSLIGDFGKKSELAFQKATFLIGPELGKVKEAISLFMRDIKMILDENKATFETKIILRKSIQIMNELEKIDDSKAKMEEQFKQLALRKEDKKKAIDILEQELTRVKKSESHQQLLKRGQEHEKDKQELVREASKLKEAIDFKRLASIFHVNEKKMNILREYNNNFISSLASDSGESLIGLLVEAGFDKEIIYQIASLAKKIGEISKFTSSSDTEEIERNISKIKTEIEHVDNESSRLEKARDKLEESKISTVLGLREEIGKLNIDLKE